MSTQHAQPDPRSAPEQPAADPGPGLDLRLAPAAVLVWLVCGVGVGLAPDAAWVGVLLLLLVAAGLLHRLRARVRARHRQEGHGALAAWVLALLLAAALLATVAVRGADRAELVRELDGTEAEVTLRLQREARPHEDGALADALLLAVDGRAGTLRTPVLVLADADWLDLPFGARVQTQARLAGTDLGDDRTFLVLPHTVQEVHGPRGWRARVAQIRT